MKQHRYNRGVAIILAIIVLSSVFAISFGISTVFLKEIRLGRTAGFYIPALFAADAGMEKILTLRKDPTSFTLCLTKTDAQTKPECKLSNGAGFWIVAKKGGDAGCAALNFCVVSNGEFGGTRRAFEVNY